MAAKDLDAVFYVRNIPDITFENDGMFHVAYDVGKRSSFEFVFSPNTFLKMRRAASRVVDQFQQRDGISEIKEGRH